MILIGTVHDISAKIVSLFNCGEVTTKAAAFELAQYKFKCVVKPELFSFGRYLFVLFYKWKKTSS